MKNKTTAILLATLMISTLVGCGAGSSNAQCILLFSPQDIVINRFLLEHKEAADIDPADIEIIKERDNQRLQAMERYCYTTVM